MKNPFGKKQQSIPEQKEAKVQPEDLYKRELIEPIKAVEVKQELTEKQWKSAQFQARNELTIFLNANGINPEFIIPGSNGSFNIFYKG